MLTPVSLLPTEPADTEDAPLAVEENSPPPAPPPSDVTEPETCYHRCLPLLLQSFQDEKSTKQLPEIANKLQLLPGQLADWLRRAIEEGKLTRKKKKGRIVYTAATGPAEQTLFDRPEDTT